MSTPKNHSTELCCLDTFTFKVANPWDPKNRKFPYSGKDKFAPGRKVELSLGYREDDKLTPMIKGEITSIMPVYPSHGASLLVVRGRCDLAKFMGTQQSKVYIDKKDSDIAKEIASSLGVELRTDGGSAASEPVNQYVIQANTYDIVFLKQLAHRRGYELMVEDNNGDFSIYFGPSLNVRGDSYALVYGTTLHEFQPTLDTRNQVESVEVHGWDWVNKKKISATSKRSDFSAMTDLDGPIKKTFRGRKEVICEFPVADQSVATGLAKGSMQSIMQEMVTGFGSAPGYPELRSGSVTDISGLDERFNGRYLLAKAFMAGCGRWKESNPVLPRDRWSFPVSGC